MSNKTPNLMSDLMCNKVSDCCARYRSIPTCTSGGPTDLELLCTVWQPRRGGAGKQRISWRIFQVPNMCICIYLMSNMMCNLTSDNMILQICVLAAPTLATTASNHGEAATAFRKSALCKRSIFRRGPGCLFLRFLFVRGTAFCLPLLQNK